MAIIRNLVVPSTVMHTTSTNGSTAGSLYNGESGFNLDAISVSKNTDAAETMNRLIYAANLLIGLNEEKPELAEGATVLGLTLPRILSQIVFTLTGNPRKDSRLAVLKNQTIAGKFVEKCPSLHSRTGKVDMAPFLSLKKAETDGSTQVPSTLFNIGKLNRTTKDKPVGDSIAIALAIVGGEVDKDRVVTNSYKVGTPKAGSTFAPMVLDVEAGQKINIVREAHFQFAKSLPKSIPNRSTPAGSKQFQTWLTDNLPFLQAEMVVTTKSKVS